MPTIFLRYANSDALAHIQASHQQPSAKQNDQAGQKVMPYQYKKSVFTKHIPVLAMCVATVAGKINVGENL